MRTLKRWYQELDDRVYAFYRNSLYLLQDHPGLFWLMLGLAVNGCALTVYVAVGLL